MSKDILRRIESGERSPTLAEIAALAGALQIAPSHQVQRDPIARDTLAVLLRHSRRGSSTDEVLRGMARRAGLLG